MGPILAYGCLAIAIICGVSVTVEPVQSWFAPAAARVETVPAERSFRPAALRFPVPRGPASITACGMRPAVTRFRQSPTKSFSQLNSIFNN